MEMPLACLLMKAYFLIGLVKKWVTDSKTVKIKISKLKRFIQT